MGREGVTVITVQLSGRDALARAKAKAREAGKTVSELVRAALGDVERILHDPEPVKVTRGARNK